MRLANTFYINRTKLAEELGVSVATLRNCPGHQLEGWDQYIEREFGE